MASIKEILESLGYKLKPDGDFWRTAAIYRGGKNPTALSINKKTGTWIDFAISSSSRRFKELLELTTGKKDVSNLINSVEIEDGGGKQNKIQMEKIYSNDELKSLLPNYFFYKKRNISEDTQKLYKCGFCGYGKLYRRIVFPIFSEYGDIIGWSGRRVDENKNIPKWKHLGKKSEWIYPINIPEWESKSNIPERESKSDDEIFIVESIGDSMALTENGIKNHLVSFGLSLSSKMIAFLIARNYKKIYLCFNNDGDKDSGNNGEVAAIKNFLKLSKFFNPNKIEIKFPFKNDFGDMNTFGDSFSDWIDHPCNTQYTLQKAAKNCNLTTEQKKGAEKIGKNYERQK